MKIGLVGLQNSGKTTIFNALTKSEAEVTMYASIKTEPNLAIVDVGDERVIKLSEMYRPKKMTFATLELLDFVGLAENSARGNSFPAEFLRLIKNMDALALVVRNFPDDLMGEPDPLTDLAQLTDELLLADLILIESRLEKIEWNSKRVKKTIEVQFEEKTLRKLLEQLNQNLPIRDLDLSADERRAIQGFQFITSKPVMVILNSAETNFGRNQALLDGIAELYRVVEFAGKFEMELSRLDDEAASFFMDDMGITESARDRLTQLAYEILGYISFFTVGPDEVRAWNIQIGDTAVAAAGEIHSDLARGFIRAECFSYDDLVRCGTEKSIREKGLFRLEGKEYLVRDGDILSIRFNV